MAMRSVQGKQDTAPVYYYELCNCHDADWSHPPSGISGRALLAAAEDGCLTCSIVKGALAIALGEPVKEEYNIVYKLKSGYGIKICYMLKDEWSTERKFQVFLAEGEPALPPPLHLDHVKEIHEEPLSERSLQRIQELLEDCNLNHSRCSVTELPALPTRVIVVGDDKTPPRLLCMQGERAEYLALSHCWGTEQNFTTTTETLDERTRGIAWEDLPKTFQDAITLARVLNFSYLWIDSLCILQDDRKDWEREGMKMGMIYENASLTVAASLSSADKDGFLIPRTQYKSHDFTIKHQSVENGTVVLQVRTAIKKHLRRDIGRIRHTWRANLSMPAAAPEPLDYRAWCYQEKIVSRRLLSFCISEIEWDCQSGTNCECGARRRLFDIDGPDARNGSPRQAYQSLQHTDSGVPRSDMRGGNSRGLSTSLVELLNPSSEIKSSATESINPPEDARETNSWLLWRTRLVPSYSQLRLTKEMDRLPALSAVARGLEPLAGRQGYLAGMWLSDLANALSWQAGAYSTNGPRPGRLSCQYRAPSWSWASIEGPVDACFDYEDDYHPICNILSVHYSLAGEDPFSNVESASARIRGHLVPATLRTTQAPPKSGQDWEVDYYCEANGTACKLHMYPDTPIGQTDSSLHRSSLNPGESQGKLDGNVQLLAILMARPRTMTGFKDRTTAPTLDFGADRWITFLVLTHSRTGSDCFCRIGIVPHASSVRLSGEGDQWYKRWPMEEITLV
ncbi:hypothetical protein BP6252_14016 [Coleophoma cylindrospora]|uniref:Heterokaryon incompatibility domain-containing protein n=1 Tax=Coleophoma cylindrospora TaxID=1849047 RepID=A0A3D8Q4H5_9HELO|nr:hypothetical protein BP6252_14016 [Coleophoma cylindrospora]